MLTQNPFMNVHSRVIPKRGRKRGDNQMLVMVKRKTKCGLTTVDYYMLMKNDELTPFTGSVNLENIMVSERNRSQEAAYGLMLFL